MGPHSISRLFHQREGIVEPKEHRTRDALENQQWKRKEKKKKRVKRLSSSSTSEYLSRKKILAIDTYRGEYTETS